MTILYLITRAEQGGAQTKVLTLAKFGLAQGHQVRIGMGEDGWLTERAAEAGIPTVVFKHLKRTWSPLSIRPFLRELKQEITERPTDVLHMHSSNTLFGAFLRGCLGSGRPKTMATVCGLSIMNPGWTGSRFKKAVFNFVTAKMWARSDHIIFVCNWDRDFALSKGFAQETNSSVVYNGLPDDVPYFSRSKARQKLGVTDDNTEFVVGTVARLDYQKDIDLFIDLADVLRDERMKFRVVGAGEDLERLEKRIRQLGLRDKIEIISEARDAFRLVPGFDAFVLTSRYEGFPWTLLEAEQARVPMVSMAVAGCPEIVINGETGWLVRERNPKALAAAVREVRDNSEQAKRLADNAYRRGRELFSEEVLVNGNYSIYRNLLSDGQT